MGLLDLPAPLFAWLDMQLSALAPAALRLMLWALAAAVLSMMLYRRLSPQQRIARIEAATQQLKEVLARHDGDLAEGLRLSRRLLGLALARVRLVSLPALVAAIPVICLMAWLSTSYGYVLPDGSRPVEVRAEPDSVQAIWIDGEARRAPRVAAIDETGRVVGEVPVIAPVATVHKRAWWNLLVGNPIGYLPSDGPVERIDFDLPRVEYLPIGPAWLRGWEALFIGVMLLGSIALKLAFKIR